MKKLFLSLGLLLASISNAWAWDAIAHRIIAQIAADNLTVCSKAQVNKLFLALQAPYPQHENLLRAADWLDKDNSTCPYDSTHCMPPPRSWHFIDRAFNIGAAAVNNVEQNYPPPNVVWAIDQELAWLENPNASTVQQAIALLLLDHLLGDVTQPLHNSNGYNLNFPLPKGDRGGNAYSIKASVTCYNRRGHPYTRDIDNLHSYWDQGAGLFSCQSPKHNWQGFVANFAKQQEYAYQHNQQLHQFIDSELANHDSPESWSWQAYDYAPQVYQIAYQSEPSAAYAAWAQDIVKQQVTLAGYRLAQVLNQAMIKNGSCK